MNNKQPLATANSKSQLWSNKELRSDQIRKLLYLPPQQVLDTFLRKYSKETPAGFAERKHIAVNKNIIKEMLSNFVNKMLSKPITIETSDPWLKQKEYDFDGKGRTIHQFANDLLFLGEAFSEAYTFLDIKETDFDYDFVLTILDLKNILHTRADDEEVYYVRFREYEIRENGFDDVVLTTVKEIKKTPEGVLYSKFETLNDGGTLTVVDNKLTDFNDIPFFEFYPNGFKERFCVDLQWEDLANQQVKLLNASSHYTNLSKNSSVPIMLSKGLSKQNSEITMGSGFMLNTENPNASIEYIETKGASLAEALKAVTKQEEDMLSSALNVNVNRESKTATQSIIDEATINSILANHMIALKHVLEKIIDKMIEIKFDGKKIDYKLNITIKFVAKPDQIQLQALDGLHDRGLISDKTYLNEYKNNGFLNEDYSYEDDSKELEDKKQPEETVDIVDVVG